MDIDDAVTVCEVCGAEDLIHHGNEARCPHCGTTVTTQQSTVVLDESTQFRYLSQVIGPSQLKEKAQAKLTERLQPWKLSEAFQHILLTQISAIAEALDLPTSYKSMVVKVWMQYLKATGEAFLSDSDRANCLYPHGWGWLYDPVEGQEAFRKLTTNKRKKAKLQPLDEKTKEGIEKQLDAEQSLRNLEFEDDESFLFSSSSSDLSSSDDDGAGAEEREGKEAGVRKKQLRTTSDGDTERKYWRGWLSKERNSHLLEFNLAVCYLPLPFMERQGHQFGLVDLLSVVTKGRVPYQNARAELPDWMCVRDSVLSHFLMRNERCPTRHRMEQVIRALIEMIGVSELPQLPLLTYISQLTAQLRLPARVGQVAGKVARLWMNDDRLNVRNQGRRREKSNLVTSSDTTASSFLLLVLVWLHGESRWELRRRDDLVCRLMKAAGRSDIFLFSHWLNVTCHSIDCERSLNDINNKDAILCLPPIVPLVDKTPIYAQDWELGPGVRTDGRLVHKHEHLLLTRKRHFVDGLLAPLRPLIDSSHRCEAQEAIQEEYDFTKDILAFPRQREELREELSIMNSSAESEDLFDDDSQEKSVDAILAALPDKSLLASAMAMLLPNEMPEDLKPVTRVVAHALLENPVRVWRRAVMLQKSVLGVPAVNLRKTYMFAGVGQLLKSRTHFSLS